MTLSPVQWRLQRYIMQGLGRGKAGKVNKNKRAKQGFGVQALANLRKVLNLNQLLVPKAVFERVLRFDFFTCSFLSFSIFSLVPLFFTGFTISNKNISFIQGSHQCSCQEGKVEREAEVEELSVWGCRGLFSPGRPWQNLNNQPLDCLQF